MKYVVGVDTLKVDMGEGQFIHVDKLGVLDVQQILSFKTKGAKTPEDIDTITTLTNSKKLILRVVKNWEGFCGEDGTTEIPFSKEVLEKFVSRLNGTEFEHFFSCLVEALEPGAKDKAKVEELEADLKN